jgi:phenylacetic acid degradation operon negative regulatory protein
VIASTLLGMHPPRLPSRILVRWGELFGIGEGTTRTAISRMVAAGELEAEDGAYRLAGPLLERQARQDASREAHRLRWGGGWELAGAPSSCWGACSGVPSQGIPKARPRFCAARGYRWP